MGSRDSVLFTCPTCEKEIVHETTSWGGESYDQDTVPEDMADDIIRESVECGECGSWHEVRRARPVVRLELVNE